MAGDRLRQLAYAYKILSIKRLFLTI